MGKLRNGFNGFFSRVRGWLVWGFEEKGKGKEWNTLLGTQLWYLKQLNEILFLGYPPYLYKLGGMEVGNEFFFSSSSPSHLSESVSYFSLSYAFLFPLKPDLLLCILADCFVFLFQKPLDLYLSDPRLFLLHDLFLLSLESCFFPLSVTLFKTQIHFLYIGG